MLVLTQNIDRVGWMSCNPSVGGVGKTHLVKEVDALGGLMAHGTDASGIHYRRLNMRKGPAVRATRAQADKLLYAAWIRQAIEAMDGLTLKQASVTDLIIDDRSDKMVVRGVETAVGIRYLARSVVLTTGTFMGGLCHYGEKKVAGGRAGDSASSGLSGTLHRLGMTIGRLKTGTVPRLDGRTIDWASVEEQPGEASPRPMASYGQGIQQRQVSCYITYTNEQTHDIIRANLHRSPMFSGDIEGTGPRYCPSIEDKVVRFADRDRHQIFLEPEGLSTAEIYPAGISTSLPADAQISLIRSIPGLERAEITRFGYAVEYDFVNPQQLQRNFETTQVSALFLAGQINGTSGYEEAAIQGLLAGVNAIRSVRAEPAFTLDRAEAYGGVLIDDLVNHGADEPYRMFTSRAEYRLMLREDNADDRLIPKARDAGLVHDAQWHAFTRRRGSVDDALSRLRSAALTPSDTTNRRLLDVGLQPLKSQSTLAELLKRPEVHIDHLIALGNGWLDELDAAAQEKVEIELKYEGYIHRQRQQVERYKVLEAMSLPSQLCYEDVAGLSKEAIERLERGRPSTIGQASRLAGVTPAAIQALMVHLKVSERVRQEGLESVVYSKPADRA